MTDVDGLRAPLAQRLRDILATPIGEQAEATRKAARRLGVTPRTVEAAAVQLWGRPLGAECDLRVEPRPDEERRSLHARRAQVTRDLDKELRIFLNLADGGDKTEDA